MFFIFPKKITKHIKGRLSHVSLFAFRIVLLFRRGPIRTIIVSSQQGFCSECFGFQRRNCHNSILVLSSDRLVAFLRVIDAYLSLYDYVHGVCAVKVIEDTLVLLELHQFDCLGKFFQVALL